jgi:hypothetical protein
MMPEMDDDCGDDVASPSDPNVIKVKQLLEALASLLNDNAPEPAAPPMPPAPGGMPPMDAPPPAADPLAALMAKGPAGPPPSGPPMDEGEDDSEGAPADEAPKAKNAMQKLKMARAGK